MIDFPPGRWHGSWLWSGGSPPGRDVIALGALLPRPRARRSRSAARARCPGTRCGSTASRWPGAGPVEPPHQPYDLVDLAPHLRAGDNVIAVLGVRYAGATPWWLPPPVFGSDLSDGAFVFEARLGEDDWLVSDAGGPASCSTGGRRPGVGAISGRGRETVDLARAAAATGCPTDPGWPAAVERKAAAVGEPGRPEPPSYPIGPLLPAHRSPSPSRPTCRSVRRTTARTTARSESWSAPWSSTSTAPSAPRSCSSVAEMVDADGSAGAERARRLRRVRPRRHPPDGRVDRPLRAARACRGHRARGRHRPRRHRRRAAPPRGGRRVLRLLRPRLDRIWEVGRRTVSICSLDAYVDCPTREQRAWTGDHVVHQMVDLATNDDWTLARWQPAPHRLAAARRHAADGRGRRRRGRRLRHDPGLGPALGPRLHNLYRYVGDRDEVAGLLAGRRGRAALVRALPRRRRLPHRRDRLGHHRLGVRCTPTACAPR